MTHCAECKHCKGYHINNKQGDWAWCADDGVYQETVFEPTDQPIEHETIDDKACVKVQVCSTADCGYFERIDKCEDCGGEITEENGGNWADTCGEYQCQECFNNSHTEDGKYIDDEKYRGE